MSGYPWGCSEELWSQVALQLPIKLAHPTRRPNRLAVDGRNHTSSVHETGGLRLAQANIATPSYNQMQFIDEETIHPVLVQRNDLGLSLNQYDNNKQDY